MKDVSTVMWVTPLAESVPQRLDALRAVKEGELRVVVVAPASFDELLEQAVALAADVVVLYAAPGVDKVAFAAAAKLYAMKVYRPDFDGAGHDVVFTAFRRVDTDDIVNCFLAASR